MAIFILRTHKNIYTMQYLLYKYLYNIYTIYTIYLYNIYTIYGHFTHKAKLLTPN